MVYRGRVENGLVRLEDAPPLPDGLEVEVHLLAESQPVSGEEAVPSLYERLKDIVGEARGLPPDLAENHDYYLHGRPKP